MKLLVVDHNAILESDRGLYRALNNVEGVHLTLVVPRRWREYFGDTIAEPDSGSLAVIRGTALFAGKSHRAIYISLERILRSEQPDIVYVNSEPEGYLAWQAVVLRERMQKKPKLVISSWRNIDYSGGNFPYKLARLSAHAERRVLASADHCIAHTETAKEIYAQSGFTRVTVIPPAVDAAIFRKEMSAVSDRCREGIFYIGYVGRFVPEKGIDILLRAAKILTFPYQLVLAGDGPAKRQLRRLAWQLGVDEHVVWRDPMRHADVPLILGSLDVLVLPSRATTSWREQFGRVLIEAMASGVPVVGSSSGEIPNVIGDAGLVFKEGDAEALALGLERLNSDPHLRADLIRRGDQRVSAHYGVPCIAPAYLRLFKSLLHDNGPLHSR